MIRVKILLFAHFRERFKKSEMTLEVPEGTEAGDLIFFLIDDRRQATSAFRSTLFAVNGEYCSPKTRLEEGMEVSLIPPVAGG